MLIIIEYLSRQPKNSVTTVCLLVVILVGAIDYITGYDVAVELLYIIPVFLVSASVGKYPGLLVATISAIVKYLSNLLLLLPEQNHLIFYWNNLIYFLTSITFVLLTSALTESIHREKQISRIDFLTGISNRKAFFEFVDLEINRCRRNRQCLTIAYMDCDNFKQVNDQLGHRVGDELLSLVADTIKINIRSTDLVARLGGDEFAIILPNTGKETAFQIFSRLENILLAQMQQNQWAVTFSIGVATFSIPPKSTDELIHQADQIMYDVKMSGKGRFEHKFFN